MMPEKSTFLELWDKQKGRVVFFSAIVPIIAVIAGFLTGYDKESLVKLGLGLIGYQLAFLIGLVFETQRLVTNKKVMKITKIQLNKDFWPDDVHYKTMYLNALNGDRFFEMIANHNIKVDDVKVIAPSKMAVDTYYANDVVVIDQEKAARMMEESIENIEINLNELIKSGSIVKADVRRLGTFPLDFYAMFDSRKCLVGKYLKDPLRKPTIGLKSLSWIEDNPQLINHHAQHFEELWNSLEPKYAE